MRLAPKHTTTLALICVAAIVAALYFEKTLNDMFPANRYFIAKNLVWFPIGMLLAIAIRQMDQWRHHFFWPAGISVVLLLVTRQWNVYALTISLFLLACSVKTPPQKSWTYLSEISFGIYLAHVLFIETFQFVIPKIGLSVASLAITIGVIVASSVASVILCTLLDRSPRTRWSVR